MKLSNIIVCSYYKPLISIWKISDEKLTQFLRNYSHSSWVSEEVWVYASMVVAFMVVMSFVIIMIAVAFMVIVVVMSFMVIMIFIFVYSWWNGDKS